MQLRPQEIKNLTKAGIFLGFLIFVCMIFIFTLGKERSLFSGSNTYKAQVKNLENLKKGAAVFLKGMKVGSIDEIRFIALDTIEIIFSVAGDVNEWVREDSQVFIRTQGMLGDKYLEIDGGTQQALMAKDGSTLIHGGESGLGKFVDQGEDILKTTNQILDSLNHILGDMNTQSNIGTTIENMGKTTSSLNHIISSIDAKKLASSIDRLNTASINFEQMSKRMTEGPGTIHSLIYDNSVYDDLRTLLGGAQRSQVIKYFIRESIKQGTKVEAP